MSRKPGDIPPSSRPPRVLIVMPDQWRRALLRATLREVGYDAVGTRDVSTAMRIAPEDPERGNVRLVIVDQDAIGLTQTPVEALLDAHHAPSILIARSTIAPPPGPWRRTLTRPLAIDDIVTAAQSLLPLPPIQRYPIDS